MMNEFLVHDGTIERELDHNGMLQALGRMLSMQVQLRRSDGRKRDIGMKYMIIIHQMFIWILEMLIIGI
jgi:hypothetical protein